MKSTFNQIARNSISVFALGLMWAMTAARPVSAEPDWWTGTPKELLGAAIQNNKSIVLYFESKGSEDCERMDAETWPNLDAASTSQFLWKRCMSGNEADKKFFETYQINMAPEIVVIDAERRERGRLKDFLAPDLIMNILEGLPSYDDADSKKPLTYGNGMVFTAAQALAEGFDASKHNYYLNENFDSVQSLNDLNKSFFDPFVNPGQSMDIIVGEGTYKTNGLMVTGYNDSKLSLQQNPAVALRVDLSANFDKINMALGVVEVRFWTSVLALPAEGLTDVFAITVLPNTSKAPTVADILGRHRDVSRFYPRSNEDTSWKEITLRTHKPVTIKKESVWLTFWVNEAPHAFIVDDLRVRLLTEEQVKAADARLASRDKTDTEADVRKMLEVTEKAKIGYNFNRWDVNKDMKLQKKEIPGYQVTVINMQSRKTGKNFDQWFAERDRDKSGFLDPTEYNQ